MTDEQLYQIGERLIGTYRLKIQTWQAYYSREPDDPDLSTLEAAYLRADEAWRKADFTHLQALILRSPATDPTSETAQVAAEYLAGLGYS